MFWSCSVDGVQDLERLRVVCAPDLLLQLADSDLLLSDDWVLLVLVFVEEERIGGRTALSRANADFSSATIRLWRVSNNSLLGISVMSLYLSDPMRSLCAVCSVLAVRNV